jgi:hypothetical protein
MSRIVSGALLVALGFGMGITVADRPAAEDLTKQKTDPPPSLKIVDAAELAAAFTKDAKKANRDFGPKIGGPTVQITGRVTKVVMRRALLNNANSTVRVYVSLGDKPANMGDLIDATVKKLQYDDDTKDIIVESDNVKVARESSGAVPMRSLPAVPVPKQKR